jgi:hypothetical protein
LISDIVTATRRHAEKQQTRTLEEKLALIEEEEFGTLPDVEEADEDEDEDGPLYNPLNLPLGWDGKPIPFWLYKLHGLAWSSNVRYAGIKVTGGAELLIVTFKNGGMLMGCGVWVFPTRSTSTTSL